MRFFHYLAFFTLLLSSGNIFGQRVEIEQKKLGANPQIVPIGKEGLIIFYETTQRVAGMRREWVFTKYDTTFKEVWSKEYAVERNREYSKYDLENENLYLFLTSSTREITILTLHLADGSIRTTDSRIIENSAFTDFNVISNKAFITGRTSPTGGQNCLQGVFNCTCIPLLTGATVYKIKPIIYSVDLKGTETPIKKVDFKEIKGHGSIVVSEPSSDNKQLDCMVKNYLKPRDPPIIQLRRYNADGKELRKTTLKSETNNELITGKLNNLSDSEQVLMGTYSIKSKGRKFVFNDFNNVASEGMYFGKYENGSQKFLKFFEFKKFGFYQKMLDDWSTYNNSSVVNQKRRSRMENRPLSYLLLVHDIIEKNNQYLIVAETYILSYHTECRTTYSSNGGSYQTCYQVFDGYIVTGAIVAGFSKEGEKLWDNFVSISSSPSYTLRPRVNVVPKENEVQLTYAFGGNLETKIVKGSAVTGLSSQSLDMAYHGDHVKYTWQSDVNYWYGNYYVAHGYEKIRNYDSNNGGRKNVFFFNKIAVAGN
jgi:hypothetical protein